MNRRNCAACFAGIKPVDARLAPVLLLAAVLAGCAVGTEPRDFTRRDGNTVIHGTISTIEFPRNSDITVEIDRRIYFGTVRKVAPNQTFGIALAHGKSSRAAEAGGTPGADEYYTAVLSSSDNHVLRCDFTGTVSRLRVGICVDDFGSVYDVASSQ